MWTYQIPCGGQGVVHTSGGLLEGGRSGYAAAQQFARESERGYLPLINFPDSIGCGLDGSPAPLSRGGAAPDSLSGRPDRRGTVSGCEMADTRDQARLGVVGGIIVKVSQQSGLVPAGLSGMV